MDVRPSEPFRVYFGRLIRNGKHRFPKRQCQPHRDGIADLAVFRCACPHELPIIGELLDAGIFPDAQGAVLGRMAHHGCLLHRGCNQCRGWLAVRQPPVEADFPTARAISAAHGLFPYIFREVAPIPTLWDKAEVCKAVFAECGTLSTVIFQILDGVLQSAPAVLRVLVHLEVGMAGKYLHCPGFQSKQTVPGIVERHN